ncbi:MAG: isocitrate dehydrogenase kinase/phosphatase-domain containing protein, partial [Microcystaceae cyanobacterium]
LCSQSCYIEGDMIVIKQLFTERKIRPLNLFVDENDFETAAKAILDYGNAVKELAAVLCSIAPGLFWCGP